MNEKILMFQVPNLSPNIGTMNVGMVFVLTENGNIKSKLEKFRWIEI
jgi:hypothetical protein